MSIYPGGKRPEGLTFKWDVAAIDVPVPARLLSEEDKWEWRTYVDSLPPAKQLRKLAQALDQLHGQLEKAAAAQQPLTRDEQIEAYSKWTAANDVAVPLATRFGYPTPLMRGDQFQSDIDSYLFFIADFLGTVQSPETKAWEDRRERHNSLNEGIRAVLNVAYRQPDGFALRENQPKGGAPTP